MHIKLSSTNPKVSGGKSVVRVYLNGKMIAEEYVSKRSPVQYLKGLTRSKHLISLERQLISHGLTLTDVGLR
jgi:hypothetical protein